MIFLFAIYVVFEIVTVSAVKSCNRKGESFPKPHRRQTFVEGESISRITRYMSYVLCFNFIEINGILTLNF